MRVIIPARYASTRLPGKPLQDVHGQTLIQRVYNRAIASGATSTIIATDDVRIKEAAEAFGAQVCMTSTEHRSGTERIAEVIRVLGIDDNEVIVDLQGDEPLMPAALIAQVAETLAQHPNAVVATAMYPITDQASLYDPNVVKVVCDHEGFALFFSRAAIPNSMQSRANSASSCLGYRHIGLYAYEAGLVNHYVSLPPCRLEQVEALEQLRILWYGMRIAVCEASEAPGPGVDTPEDLQIVRDILRKNSNL
ncbi:MAG: 3-deoxy-manno-octulosonate cytidylyltransferase [Gammaproteobacteria bacterium]|nr:3-deoxy-manno-octulosonate cytidylyltransferase [Gammaproteobacteria bacterium]